MSRRKDRERVAEMQGRYPAHQGFRGFANEPNRQGYSPLVVLKCVRCKRKRNVAARSPLHAGGYQVCHHLVCKTASPSPGRAPCHLHLW
mgnify:CR=1 FL=1